MGISDILLLAIALAMDAFAISTCKGLCLKKVTLKNASVCGAWFGSFQGLMPLLGYLAGSVLAGIIDRFSGWVVFIILSILGINMIREAFSREEATDPGLDIKTMFAAAVATSIDAFAVGVTFTAIPVNLGLSPAFINIIIAVLIIGIITFIISVTGTYIGGIFGMKYKGAATITGGCILILLGIKSLLETLKIIG